MATKQKNFKLSSVFVRSLYLTKVFGASKEIVNNFVFPLVTFSPQNATGLDVGLDGKI